MKTEISRILGLIADGNIGKGLQEAKLLYKANEKNLSVAKLLVYTYVQLGNFEKVISLLEKHFSLNIADQDFDYFNNMGYSLTQLEEFQKAIIFLSEAAKRNDQHPGPYANLGAIQQKLRNFSKAKEFIDMALARVLKLDKKMYSIFTNIFLSKSEINSALNQDSETIEIFSNLLIEAFNENIFYLLTLVDAKNLKKEIVDNALDCLKKTNVFKTNIERFNYITPLYFGLGNYYQSIDIKLSEHYFDLGNLEIFKSSRYNSHEYQLKILKTIDVFQNDFLNLSNDDEDGDENFFIIGSPRSGTTLLESIVTANDKIFSGGELTSAKHLIEKYMGSNNKNINVFIKEFRDTYVNRTRFIKGHFRFIVDKMPENFLYLGILTKLLPRSKILRILRNPWDIAISLYKQRYIINVPYSSSFFNIGVFLANFEAVNSYWDRALNNHSNVFTLKYEELVTNQQHYKEQIYQFLDLEVGAFDEQKRDSFFSSTASIRQVSGDIHKKSLNKNEFEHKKSEFYESLQMQREFWKSKGIIEKNDDFYGYLSSI